MTNTVTYHGVMPYQKDSTVLVAASLPVLWALTMVNTVADHDDMGINHGEYSN